jgi:hypothetical protein
VLELLGEAVGLGLPVGHGLVKLLEALLQLAVHNPSLGGVRDVNNIPLVSTRAATKSFLHKKSLKKFCKHLNMLMFDK